MTQSAREHHEAHGKADHIAVLVRSLDGGGVQRRAISLVRHFAWAGRTVDLYVVDPVSSHDLPSSVRVISLSERLPRSTRGLPSRFRARFEARVLAAELRGNPPDLLLASGPTVHAIAARAKVSNVPLVLRASSHPFRPLPWRRPAARLIEIFERRLRSGFYRTGDFIVAVAADVAAAVHTLAPHVPTVTLPSPVVSPEFLAAARRPLDHPWLQDGVPLILAVGRFTVAKDFPTLIRAFALLRRERRARLLILGDGPKKFRNELSRLAARLNVVEDIAMPGWSDEVAQWLANAALMVSSSLWEGSPGVIIEAMAVGCPVVATDCPGDSRALLQDGRIGGLVPPRDAVRMAQAMAAQLDAPTAPEVLQAAVAPYRESSAAEAYLAALDRFLATVTSKP